MHLYQQHCSENTPTNTPSLLNKAQCENYFKELPQWQFNANKNEIFRTFSFKNYYECLAFVNAVGWIAQQQDHHPKIEFSYNTCSVFYSTHSAGGITLFDFICAAHIDQLLNKTNNL